jgi:purine catabolism regulator
VNIQRLLALPEWAGTVRVLAGRNGLGRDVRLLRASMDLVPDHPVEPDELLVVTSAVAPGDWRLDALLRRTADAGGAAVLVPVTELLEATRRLGDRLDVPVLSTDASPLDLLVAARLALAAPELDRAGLVLAAHRALGERLRSPDEIVEILRGLLRAPVALLDDRGKPLAGELATASFVHVDEPVPQRIELADGVLLVHPAMLPGTTLWLATELRGVLAARADVVPPALAVATGAVQRWLLTNRIELERDARARTALLGDLLRVDAEPTADLRRRAADAGWRLSGWHVGVRIGTPPSVDNVARRPEVVRALRAEGVEAIVVERGDGWTAWTTFDHEPTAARVQELAAGLRAAHRTLQQTLASHMGVGKPHPSPDGLAATVAEASDAARLAATRPESGNYLHVDQLGMAQLLLEWTRTDTFEPAARALIAPLRGVPGDLVRTLAAYLDAESSIAETAAVLGIHRNTVAARVDRIARLLTVDLNHRDDRLALHLACRTVTLAEDE